MQENPLGLDGLEFIEFAGPNAAALEQVFTNMGMQKIARHKKYKLSLYRQNDINFILNQEPGTFAESFYKAHGPCACATGFRVKDAQKAFATAVERGARPYKGDEKAKGGWTMPAIYGIGDSLVYFVDKYNSTNIYDEGFEYIEKDRQPRGKGLQLIDHMTNNVPVGEMQKWCDFYERVFGFQEKRFFDIRGAHTGLLSKVMRSPCGKFSIPINEPTEAKSQIQEYLDEYKGSGIQHIALLTEDICHAVNELGADQVEFLDAPPHTYYEMLPDRLPGMREDVTTLEEHHVLADGDPEGYLLQIFTKNQIGPIFFEIISRRNHFGFGEGNFQALFDSIEADQRKRGVL